MSTSLEARKLLKALYQAERIMKAQRWLSDKPTEDPMSAGELLVRAHQEQRQQKKLGAEPFSRYKERQRLKQASEDVKKIYQQEYDYIFNLTGGDIELSQYMALREIYRSR